MGSPARRWWVRRSATYAWAAGLVALCGCGTSGENPFDAGTAGSGQGTGAALPGTDGAGVGTGDAGSGDGADETSADDAGPLLDVGAPGDGPAPCGDPDGQCEGCTAVDILFVIDNSTSMGSYQQALAAVAPTFADAIVDSLPVGTDLHVAVTTSSFYQGGGTSPGEASCEPYYEGAGMTDRSDLYDYYWTPDAMPFDENGAQGRLREHDGMTYFAVDTASDTQPMKDWLAANIQATGESGSVWEMLAAGAAYPFHPANATHNAGFLRDAGAVLVIFALTDEVGNSPEDVAVYHDMIAAAKEECGGDTCILGAGVMQPCMATAQDQRLYPLLASFGEDPIIADIGPELDDCFDDCADGDITQCDLVQPAVTCAELMEGKATAHYADALGATLAQVIAETCAQIPPAG